MLPRCFLLSTVCIALEWMRLPHCGGVIDTGCYPVCCRGRGVGLLVVAVCGVGLYGRGVHVDFEKQMIYQQQEASRHSG